MAFGGILSFIFFIGVASAYNQTTTLSNHPSIVQVEFLTELGVWTQNCVASILNSRNVLTSASCVRVAPSVSSRRIRAGAITRNTGGSILYVAAVYNYESVKNSSDISVVRLSSFLSYSPLIGQTAIPSPSFVLPNNVIMVQAGWDNRNLTGPLITTQVTSVNKTLCGIQNTNQTESICARSLNSVGVPNLDIGGPWIINNVTVGIVSGNNVREDWSRIIATAVAPFTNWIVAVAT